MKGGLGVDSICRIQCAGTHFVITRLPGSAQDCDITGQVYDLTCRIHNLDIVDIDP